MSLQRTRLAYGFSICSVCCLPHQLDRRDCSELSLFVWPDPGLVNGRQSGHKDSSLQQGDLERLISPLLLLLGAWQGSLLWDKTAKISAGCKVERAPLVQGAEKHGEPTWKRGFIMYESWRQKADQGSSQLQELAVLFVSLWFVPSSLVNFLPFFQDMSALFFSLY